MIRNAALLTIILLAAPVVAAAEPPNPMATPMPTPGPKINTELKVAPGILLRKTPKPVACLGAQSKEFLLSSCSGAPGTHLTLTTTLGKNVTSAKVLFKQNAGSKMTNYPATVGRSAGAYTVTVPPLCNGGKPSFSLVASYISLVPGRGSVSENLGNFTAICAPTGAIPGSKISTELKVAPGILLAGPKPTACLVAKSTDFILSSCSGAPGTQLTLTPRNTGTNVGTVQFTQNTASTLMNAYATVGRSGSGQGFGAAAYTVTVPQLCNQGLGPSFSLVVSYYTSHPQGGPYGPTVTENLGTFTVICAPTSYGTSPPSAPQVMSCGGTTNPLTADHCGKTAGAPTMSGFTATCGASITITGNTFPAGSSDWLEFVVPASHATCKTSYYATPYVSVYISSSGGILLDVYMSAAGHPVACGDGNCARGAT